MVAIQLPPPSRPITPIFVVISADQSLVRIYDPTAHGSTATGFRHFGPLLRFDHHRAFDPAGARDPERGIYYAALTFGGALIEVFGDNGFGLVEPHDREVCFPVLTRELRLLELRGEGAKNGAWRAGTVTAISQNAEYSPSQTWSRYFYENPDLYSQVDGVIYSNAHNGDPSLALFERAAQKMSCPAQRVVRLDDPGFRAYLLDACLRLGLALYPL